MKKVARSLSLFVFAAAVCLLPLNTASAQQVGGYFGVFGGYTFSPDASLWYSDSSYHYGRNYDVDVKETWVLGFKLGYTPPPLKYLAFEFEYSYLNPDLDRTVLTHAGTDYTAIEGDATLHNFMFNGLAKYPGGKVHPYIGGGLGFSYVDVSVSTTSTARTRDVYYGRSASSDDTVFAWQVLVGVDLDLTDNLSMDIGYRYFATEGNSDHDHDYDYYNTPLDYRTSMVTLGFKYRF